MKPAVIIVRPVGSEVKHAVLVGDTHTLCERPCAGWLVFEVLGRRARPTCVHCVRKLNLASMWTRKLTTKEVIS